MRKDSRIGTRIREYEILEVLGKGGMGAVYRARHVFLDHERAIKLIQGSHDDDPSFVERFIREARTLVKLDHPNLIQFYEFGSLEDNSFFMVLELLKGESVLDRVQKQQQLPVIQAVNIVRQAALGLHESHSKGIVHRDISPDNLLIVREGNREITKVIDFGIAKPLGETIHIYTKTDSFLGKPEFCSPEQCGGLREGELIDGRSDIYSLAVTLYFMLSGKLPYYSPTPAGYIVKHLQEPPRPLSKVMPPGEYSPGLELLINRALAKKREDRFATMKEFLDALEPFDSSVEKQKSPEAQIHISDMPSGHVFRGRYKIEKLIQSGRKGIIYRAVDIQTGETVALKVITSSMLPPGKSRARLQRGIHLVRKIENPVICRIQDLIEEKSFLAIVMEYVPGKSLSEILRSVKRLGLQEGLPIFKKLLTGLAVAHGAGVIHRNLKPENIMIEPNRQIRIIDFAMAVSTEGDWEHVTDSGEYIGTPDYMAPEQFATTKIDQRADIYTVGVLMFQVFTGRLPFEATEFPALVYAHSKLPPPRPLDLAPELTPGLEEIILKALEKDPANRYQNAEEMIAALKPLDQRRNDVQKILDEGRELYARSEIAKAITVWKEGLALDPQNQTLRKCIVAAEIRLRQ